LQSRIVTNQNFVLLCLNYFRLDYTVGRGLGIACNTFRMLVFSLLTDIHLIFGILLCHTKIQIKFEFDSDPLIFHEVMALGLRKKSRIISFTHFFFSYSLLFGTLLCHTQIQIKFEFGSDPLIFQELMALGLGKKSRIISFPHFFVLCLQIFILDLVHCFAIPRYSLSLSLALIQLWPLD
jgi:hypothetical protein